MTLVSFPSAAAGASRSPNNPGSVKPPTPSTPACTKLRRVIPEQSLAAPPKTRNIKDTPKRCAIRSIN
jgi:hypothetical protein